MEGDANRGGYEPESIDHNGQTGSAPAECAKDAFAKGKFCQEFDLLQAEECPQLRKKIPFSCEVYQAGRLESVAHPLLHFLRKSHRWQKRKPKHASLPWKWQISWKRPKDCARHCKIIYQINRKKYSATWLESWRKKVAKTRPEQISTGQAYGDKDLNRQKPTKPKCIEVSAA